MTKFLEAHSGQSVSKTFWSHMHIWWGHFQLPRAMATRIIEHRLSVHLRTISALLAHAQLAATYCVCLWSIRACTVMSSHSSHIQATAVRPHGCNNRAKYVSQRVPTLFLGEFCKLNNEKLTLGIIVDDMSR